MEFKWKEGRGGLFLNRKAGPKFRGEIVIDGKTIKLAAWEKETKSGDPWYSLEIDTFVPNSAKATKPPPSNEDFDDRIPF